MITDPGAAPTAFTVKYRQSITGQHVRAIDHYADLVEALFGDYEQVLSLCEIVTLVNQCRQDLAGSPPAAMPELIERLARCRLSTYAENGPGS